MRILALLSLILASISTILPSFSQSQQAELWRGDGTASAEQAERRRNQAVADNERRFGDYVLYYSVFYSSFLLPETAAATGITRSRNRAVVNVSLRRVGKAAAGESASAGDGAGLPASEQPSGMRGAAVIAELSGTVTDLIHTRPLNFQEVREPGAVYYLAPLRFGHRDHLYFSVQVLAAGESSPYRLKFERRLYVAGKQ